MNLHDTTRHGAGRNRKWGARGVIRVRGGASGRGPLFLGQRRRKGPNLSRPARDSALIPADRGPAESCLRKWRECIAAAIFVAGADGSDDVTCTSWGRLSEPPEKSGRPADRCFCSPLSVCRARDLAVVVGVAGGESKLAPNINALIVYLAPRAQLCLSDPKGCSRSSDQLVRLLRSPAGRLIGQWRPLDRLPGPH